MFPLNFSDTDELMGSVVDQISMSALAKLHQSLDDSTIKGDMFLYPWEDSTCKDFLQEAESWNCNAFKPFCHLNEPMAYQLCRKTCNLCSKDHPKPRGRDAKVLEHSPKPYHSAISDLTTLGMT